MKEEMMEQTVDKRDCSQIFEEKAMLEIMKREVDPFKSLIIDDVARDLNICKDRAYKFFKMSDFPCSRIGRKKTITQGAYLLWKKMYRIRNSTSSCLKTNGSYRYRNNIKYLYIGF